MDQIEKMVEPLLIWYKENGRTLPWRSDPTPYHVWVSEIMLQQTRVEAVIEYYKRFMEALPSVEHLATADEDVLLKLWEGLGYYNRVRNLKKGAVMVMDEFEGRIPAEYESLLQIPGIGSYTAGAISSIAFGRPEPAVDGNVLRIVMRLTGDESDILQASVKKKVEMMIRGVIPKQEASRFNQALMDFGATKCIPNGKPDCTTCPLKDLCTAYATDRVETLPVKTPKKSRRLEEKTVFLLECDGKYAVRKRPKTGLLSGMWEFPNFDGKLSLKEVEALLRNMAPEGMDSAGDIELLGEGKHVFSHVEWHMRGYRLHLIKPPEGTYYAGLQESKPFADRQTWYPSEWIWADREEIRRSYSIPSAFKVYTEQL